MAEKEEEKASEKADANNDDDELNALLDSALEDFDKLPSHKQASVPKEPQKSASGKKDSEEPTLNDMGLSESDIEAAGAEFEKSMKTMLGDDEELLKQWNEFAEKAGFCADRAENNGSDSAPEDVEAFEAHLFKTMKDMAENAKEMTNSSEMDENFLKAMADMNVDGTAPDFNNGIFPMMQGMMMNLLSKDVLYPALDELRTKYPPWLEEKKSTLKSDVYANYLQQYKLVCEICSEYDKESKEDSEETKKKRFDRLMGLMQKMQQYGQPPQELVGDRHFPEAGMEGNIGDDFPPNKCPMM